jgi:magnesium-transporting ATPase (P-type)
VAFDNVRTTTFFLVSSAAAAIIAVLASIFARFPAPFLPAQMIWLNVATNGVQDVALAFEPGRQGRAQKALPAEAVAGSASEGEAPVCPTGSTTVQSAGPGSRPRP